MFDVQNKGQSEATAAYGTTKHDKGVAWPCLNSDTCASCACLLQVIPYFGINNLYFLTFWKSFSILKSKVSSLVPNKETLESYHEYTCNSSIAFFKTETDFQNDSETYEHVIVFLQIIGEYQYVSRGTHSVKKIKCRCMIMSLVLCDFCVRLNWCIICARRNYLFYSSWCWILTINISACTVKMRYILKKYWRKYFWSRLTTPTSLKANTMPALLDILQTI